MRHRPSRRTGAHRTPIPSAGAAARSSAAAAAASRGVAWRRPLFWCADPKVYDVRAGGGERGGPAPRHRPARIAARVRVDRRRQDARVRTVRCDDPIACGGKPWLAQWGAESRRGEPCCGEPSCGEPCCGEPWCLESWRGGASRGVANRHSAIVHSREAARAARRTDAIRRALQCRIACRMADVACCSRHCRYSVTASFLEIYNEEVSHAAPAKAARNPCHVGANHIVAHAPLVVARHVRRAAPPPRSALIGARDRRTVRGSDGVRVRCTTYSVTASTSGHRCVCASTPRRVASPVATACNAMQHRPAVVRVGER